ncbi:hypothetical protein [Pseudobacteriovorax antillogorgiicola]|uniref:Uncharacterized protein n=1 Tax=Pseudobacteriovorax antillogorgiicola TaxID=1513793 RepID=A0A1Y6BC96_9BACT|nr:hypothetical protein [Pseudobacteriovorax antillogorgiicola]TCS57326.1 hypothetical protein EDD56_10366 [Pseudobacteriovorax antillogorgiicola]SMF02503.1 hypothetical protein SAMN06296036_103267 [Pseudobacteriovorax antillogorgiicola]
MMKLLSTSALVLCLISCNDNNFAGNQASASNEPEVQTPPVLSQPDNSDVVTEVTKDTESNDSVVVIDDTKALIDQCQDKDVVKETMMVELNYPERLDCQWNVAPNLEPKDSFVQAREFTTRMIEIPEGAMLCDLKINSMADAKIHYDDFLFFTLEKHVIFGTNKMITSRLDAVDNVYQWDFLKIRGTEINNFDDGEYCLGSKCILPGHDMVGPIALEFEANNIAPISVALKGKTQLALDLIATGDNDEGKDCMHTNLDLNLSATYIVP